MNVKNFCLFPVYPIFLLYEFLVFKVRQLYRENLKTICRTVAFNMKLEVEYNHLSRGHRPTEDLHDHKRHDVSVTSP